MSSSPTTLTGNLTRDPEVTTTAAGTPKVTFGIACNHSWRNANNEWEQDVSFFNVTAWRNLAEDCAVLTKGTRVVVTGRLDQRAWETDDGEKRTWIEVVADDIAVSVKGIASYERKERAEEGNRTPARAGASRPSAARRTPVATAYPDDEPF